MPLLIDFSTGQSLRLRFWKRDVRMRAQSADINANIVFDWRRGVRNWKLAQLQNAPDHGDSEGHKIWNPRQPSVTDNGGLYRVMCRLQIKVAVAPTTRTSERRRFRNGHPVVLSVPAIWRILDAMASESEQIATRTPVQQ